MGEERRVYKILVGIPKEKDHSEERGVDGRLGSERILARGYGVDSVGSG
jgi:hypothetical protein